MRMPSSTIPRYSSSSLSSSAPRKCHQSRHSSTVIDEYPPLELPLRWRDPPPKYPSLERPMRWRDPPPDREVRKHSLPDHLFCNQPVTFVRDSPPLINRSAAFSYDPSPLPPAPPEPNNSLPHPPPQITSASSVSPPISSTPSVSASAHQRLASASERDSVLGDEREPAPCDERDSTPGDEGDPAPGDERDSAAGDERDSTPGIWDQTPDHNRSTTSRMKIACQATSISADMVPDMSQRKLMNLLLLGTLSLPTGAILLPYTYFLVLPGGSGGGSGTSAKDALGIDIVAAEWLKIHGPGDRTLTQGLKGDPTYLVVEADRSLATYGINAVCTHVGCVVPWNSAENKFICPCHGSQYNYQGKVVRGPAPLSLALAHADIDEGNVVYVPWVETAIIYLDSVINATSQEAHFMKVCNGLHSLSSDEIKTYGIEVCGKATGCGTGSILTVGVKIPGLNSAENFNSVQCIQTVRRNVAKESGTIIFGPVFMFRNSTWGETDPHILWEDANLHLRIEAEYQTYAFPLSKDFQKTEEKGSVMDRLLVYDRKNYADYAEFCFKTFGERVNNWLTFNEPRVIAALGYDNGIFASERCTGCKAGGNSTTEPYIVAHNLILYHAAAVKVYHNKYQVSQKGRIGILLDFVCYESLTNSIADEDAIVHLMLVRDVSHGLYPEAISRGEDDSGMPIVLQNIRECREISDWVTRKFAADALIVLAPYSDHFITNGTSQIFETCCFDKLKQKRGNMMAALQVWKKNSEKGDTAAPEDAIERKVANFKNIENKIFDPGICLLHLLCQ